MSGVTSREDVHLTHMPESHTTADPEPPSADASQEERDVYKERLAKYVSEWLELQEEIPDTT